jgi:hypothetical protein
MKLKPEIFQGPKPKHNDQDPERIRQSAGTLRFGWVGSEALSH